MSSFAPLFSAVRSGMPLPAGSWHNARDESGKTLLHVAVMFGRRDSAWKLLLVCPDLASMPDFDLKLPEDLARDDATKLLCETARKQIYVMHDTL